MRWLTTMRNEKELTKYVSAFLYGDSSITKDKRDNGNCVFECCQIADHLDYLEWMKAILEDITSFKLSPRPGYEEKQDAEIMGIKTHIKAQYRLRSARHPFFNSFRFRLYGTGKKIIDPHYLKLLDWETLAILYMDDGYISHPISTNKYGNSYPQDILGLCTNGYSYGDNLLLKKAIKDLFDIEFNVSEERQNGNLQYRLKLRSKDIVKFLDGISKYIVPSFEYKLIQTHTGSPINLGDDIV